MNKTRTASALVALACLLGAACEAHRAAPGIAPAPVVTGSVGRPTGGALVNGRRIEPGPGIRLANPDRCWGTPEAVDLLLGAVQETQAQFPETPDLLIGDFSTENGGHLYPHKSHQSGRDVDIAMYKRGRADARAFETARPEDVDVERTWFFLETLLLSGRVQYVFLDHELQRPLRDYAAQGYGEERLTEWIEYPRRAGSGYAIIRHAGGHRDHLHIRFTCPKTDRYCED